MIGNLESLRSEDENEHEDEDDNSFLANVLRFLDPWTF